MRIRFLSAVLAVFALILPVVGLTVAPAAAIFRAAPQPSSTNCTRLSGWLGRANTLSDGQVIMPIFIRNAGSKACTVTGVPRVIYNDDPRIGAAVRLGLSAARVNIAHRGGTVTLRAAGKLTANVVLTIVPTRYYSGSHCQPTGILSGHLEFGPHSVGFLFRTSFVACSKLSSTEVGGVAVPKPV